MKRLLSSFMGKSCVLFAVILLQYSLRLFALEDSQNNLTPSDSTISPDKQAFLNYLNDQGFRSIPLENSNHRLLVKGALNGTPITWMIDSGNAAFTTIFKSFAKKAQIPVIQEAGMRIVGVGADTEGTSVFRSSKTIPIKFGNYDVGSTFLYAAELNPGLQHEGINGIFGAELMKAKRMIVDFDTNRMFAYDVAAPTSKNTQGSLADLLKSQGYTALYMVFVKNEWVIDAMVNNQRGQFTVDTGAPGKLFLTSFAAKKFNLKLEETGYTTGGVSAGSETAVSKTEFNTLKLQNHEVKLDDITVAEGGKMKTDGLLGLRFLREEKAIIDFKNSQLFIKFDDQKQ